MNIVEGEGKKCEMLGGPAEEGAGAGGVEGVRERGRAEGGRAEKVRRRWGGAGDGDPGGRRLPPSLLLPPLLLISIQCR